MTVTVAIPTYNSGRTLAAAIRSIIAQTYPDWRLVIIDDGSTDNSGTLLRALRDDRIKIIQDGRNLGLAARLNQAASICSTPLLFRMDADDIMHPDRVRTQVVAAEKFPEAVMIGCHSIAIDQNENLLGMFKEQPIPSGKRGWIKGCGLTHPTVVMRAPWARGNQYDERLPRAEDLELWVRVCETSQLVKLEALLHFYRIPDKIPFSAYRRQKRCEREIISRYFSSPAEVSQRWLLTGRTYLEEGVVAASKLVRGDHRIQARRVRRLTAEQGTEALRALEVVRQTKLPLDSYESGLLDAQ